MSEDGLMTADEAAKWIADYERDRCECGGSPAWVDPYRQLHVVGCTAPLTPPAPVVPPTTERGVGS
jgi:hypothetical protein